MISFFPVPYTVRSFPPFIIVDDPGKKPIISNPRLRKNNAKQNVWKGTWHAAPIHYHHCRPTFETSHSLSLVNAFHIPVGVLRFRSALLVVLLLLGFASLARLTLLLLILLAKGLGLELVPFTVYRCKPKQTTVSTRGLKEEKYDTYSTACLASGSSVVKYGCLSTSAAVGRFAGSKRNIDSSSS